MSLPLPDVGMLAATAAGALLIAGLLSPLEALGWWAGWFGPEDDRPAAAPKPPNPRAETYVVFLSGIHSVRGESFAPNERRFLRRLRRELPRAEVLEVFPYSVTNRALTAQRVFSWFWRWALAAKLSRRRLVGIAGMLINMRNAWQVAVSADRRYGPIYNQGSADLIHAALLAHGFDPDVGAPVVLIGYSGGGQVALGAAAPLAERFGTWPVVVSLGGVMSADPALEALPRLCHLAGRRDLVTRLGAAAFPGRWRLNAGSAWNRALAAGRIQRFDLGPMDHTGPGGYLDDEATLPDGRSHLQATVQLVGELVRDAPRVTSGVVRTPQIA